jgi:heptosyltransferase-2
MKILIIKLGLSETLDPEIGRVSSYGDVLRTTPILYALKEKYPNSHITWLVDEASEPLLIHNPYINRILIWDTFVGYQLLEEKFDIVINLEKISGLCAITKRINAWKKYGFRFDEITGTYNVYEGSEYAFDLCTRWDKKKENNEPWQKILIEMLGCTWRMQPYILGYEPDSEEIFDIGLNYKVGSKFPEKAWDIKYWENLKNILEQKGLKVSWQKGLKNLFEYINWINSNKLIISTDSLGLHIALAVNKDVIGLFGPTSSEEVFFYGHSKYIQKEKMDDIKVDEVVKLVESLTNEK